MCRTVPIPTIYYTPLIHKLNFQCVSNTIRITRVSFGNTKSVSEFHRIFSKKKLKKQVNLSQAGQEDIFSR